MGLQVASAMPRWPFQALLAIFVIAQAPRIAGGSGPPTTSCPATVVISKKVSCKCLPNACSSSNVSIEWTLPKIDKAYAGLLEVRGDTLEISAIHLRLFVNGPLVCRQTCNGETTETKYRPTVPYPPPSQPMLSAVAGGVDWGQGDDDFKQYIETNTFTSGDKIKCTIRGGKPFITRITFQCLETTSGRIVLTDEEDKGGTLDRNSNLRIPDSLTSGEFACNCSGFWQPDSTFYSFKESFRIKTDYLVMYPMVVESSTPERVIDQQHSVIYQDDGTLRITCTAMGRPNPGVWLKSPIFGDYTVAYKKPESDVEGTNTTLVYIVKEVTAKDAMDYQCVPQSRYALRKSKTLVLCVTGPPKVAPDGGANGTRDSPFQASMELKLILIARPEPNVFGFLYFGRPAAGAELSGTARPVTGDLLVFDVRQRELSKSAPCFQQFTAKLSPDLADGLYSVEVTNVEGSVEVHFTIPPDPPKSIADGDMTGSPDKPFIVENDTVSIPLKPSPPPKHFRFYFHGSNVSDGGEADTEPAPRLSDYAITERLDEEVEGEDLTLVLNVSSQLPPGLYRVALIGARGSNDVYFAVQPTPERPATLPEDVILPEDPVVPDIDSDTTTHPNGTSSGKHQAANVALYAGVSVLVVGALLSVAILLFVLYKKKLWPKRKQNP